MVTAEIISDGPDERHMDEHYAHLYEQGEMSALEAEIESGPPVLPLPISEPEDLVLPDDLPPLGAPISREPQFRPKPPANTSKAKAARDSGHDRKPWPYGSKED